jgi:hypothetical protein
MLMYCSQNGIETKSRDEKARQEETAGILSTAVFTNDGTPQHMIWYDPLHSLQHVFRLF